MLKPVSHGKVTLAFLEQSQKPSTAVDAINHNLAREGLRGALELIAQLGFVIAEEVPDAG